ncbi:hypothetical protein [Micrococcus lylae]|uniref:hypothetical protein n=1 Tax=Micrococcus lylae TaxID=1273 RepID=UPI000B352F32|nr:hypothetical protein [Micrococcus lylae]
MSVIRAVLGLALIAAAVYLFVTFDEIGWKALAGAAGAGGAVLLITAFRRRPDRGDDSLR